MDIIKTRKIIKIRKEMELKINLQGSRVTKMSPRKGQFDLFTEDQC